MKKIKILSLINLLSVVLFVAAFLLLGSGYCVGKSMSFDNPAGLAYYPPPSYCPGQGIQILSVFFSLVILILTNLIQAFVVLRRKEIL